MAVFLLVTVVTCSIGVFIVVLYAANRARKRYENKEMLWEKYHNKYLKNKRGNIISGLAFLLIGGPGLIYEGFIVEANLFFGIYAPLWAVPLYAFFFGTGLFAVAFGLAQFVHLRKKQLGETK